MPARILSQKCFQTALAPFHQYRQNALPDATVSLTRGASFNLTSIGRHLPGSAQIKNKIKRVDRLWETTSCMMTYLLFSKYYNASDSSPFLVCYCY